MNENLKSLVEKRAEEFWPNKEGIDQIKGGIARESFTAGALDPLITKAITLTEQIRMLEMFQAGLAGMFGNPWKNPWDHACEWTETERKLAESELRELLEGGKK